MNELFTKDNESIYFLYKATIDQNNLLRKKAI